jgi:hypothetical protein
MSAALDQDARSALEHFVQRARRLLEGDLAREAEGRFGIHLTDGHVEEEDGLHLDPTALSARRDVVEILDFLRREEPSNIDAVARLIREAAFTHLNRLIAIRIAEAMALLPESLANGPSSAGFRELLEVAPLLFHDASGGYWRYLQLCGDELAADLPQLFDPRNPLLELAPSSAAFDELVDMIIASDLISVWDAPDALGWTYQFFNSGDERRAMREASASPRNSRELAVRNQFFTPRYVVDFLVHNSLGRRLLEANSESGLADDLSLLVEAPTEQGAPLALVDVRVLDPACGSGHFLLGAYDVLERAWELEGVSPENAAPHIVNSLWGIDIDARCAQVAAAAVVLRARRSCKNRQLPIPNIMTARALPEPPEGWDSLLSSLPKDRSQLVRAMRDALDQAPVLGPLLKVEELLANEIRAHVAGADNDPSNLFGFDGTSKDTFEQAESDVLRVLQDIADLATSGPAERLFAAEANDAIRFVEAMSLRYDAVLMNPPFGEPVATTKRYLKAEYAWMPANAFLEAAFVGRGLSLTNANGVLGAITSRSGLFLTTYRKWREQVLLANEIVAFADLGIGVMQAALVESAAYVVRRRGKGSPPRATFIRLVRESDRASALLEIAQRDEIATDPRVYQVEPSEFSTVPGSPISYWVHPSLRTLFRVGKIEGRDADVRLGTSTGDDFRFVRLFWEVKPDGIDTEGDANKEIAWVPFAKGGAYSPFYSDIHLLVDWYNNGERLRNHPGSTVRNTGYLFRAGVTWPLRTGSGFSPRILPPGCAFGHKGPTAFALRQDETYLLLAWLSSRLVRSCLDVMVAAANEMSSGTVSKSYEVGLVQSLPVLPGDVKAASHERISDLSAKVTLLAAARDLSVETSRQFIAPISLRFPSPTIRGSADAALIEHENASIRALEFTREIEQIWNEILNIERSISDYVSSEQGAHPLDYPSTLVDESRLRSFYLAPMHDVVEAALDEQAASKAVTQKNFFFDRRLEVASHALGVSPTSIVTSRRELGEIPDGEERRVAKGLFSYLVGCAFGRWDIRVERNALLAEPTDPLSKLSAKPPGMLQLTTDESGRVIAPAGYPLALPSSGLLVDEAGHARDLEDSIKKIADLLYEESTHVIDDVLGLIGAGTIREHLRMDFFRDHLSEYSISRRKAPIYWPLTVPSGKWGVWVYAPQFSRETLYVVASDALLRERHAEAEITRLERERASGDTARGAKALDKALDEERKIAEELRRFREEADRVAGLGWEPDLNDGIVLCAAPLADLFPMWKEPAEYRKELRDGKYEWSRVSKWAGQL